MEALSEQDIPLPYEERMGCGAVFAGMFGVAMGWMLSCGVGLVGLMSWTQYPHESYNSSLALSVLGAAIASMVCALIFAAMVCWVQFFILPKSVSADIRQRWRWSTFGGSIAYWYASWILLYLMGQTDILGLVRLLREAYGNELAQITLYLAIGLIGIWAGAACMSLMVLPQCWAMDDYRAKGRWWPIGMMLANGILVAMLYVVLSYVW